VSLNTLFCIYLYTSYHHFKSGFIIRTFGTLTNGL